VSIDTNQKLESLRQLVVELGSAVVAFSGGVDSSFMLKVAHDCLGARAVGLTAVSPSLASGELEEAQSIAAHIGAAHQVIESHEVEDPRYLANTQARCYFCKTEVYAELRKWAHGHGFKHVIDGLNLDDLSDRRPGRQAASEQGIISPLAEVGLAKSEIRELSKALGLPTWDKPALACLSSRIPHGTEVSLEALTQIDRAELVLRRLGIRQVRVRHHDGIARLEVEPADFDRVLTQRETIVASLRDLGYTFVALDLQGYRPGGLNAPLELQREGKR
jgi:uncharacterized protein